MGGCGVACGAGGGEGVAGVFVGAAGVGVGDAVALGVGVGMVGCGDGAVAGDVVHGAGLAVGDCFAVEGVGCAKAAAWAAGGGLALVGTGRPPLPVVPPGTGPGAEGVGHTPVW